MKHEIIEVDYKWAHPLLKRPVAPTGITLHNAAAAHCTAKQIHQWHLANGWSGIAYGAFVAKDGRIYRGRPIWAVEAHALNCGYKLGICFEGDYERIDHEMPAAQLASGLWLVRRWKEKFRIGKKKVLAHRDEVGNSTSCPGKYFPLEKLRSA